MGKIIFDMNSRNNFNDIHGNSWWDEKIRKEIVFPPWLTLPVHYQEKKPIWSQMIRVQNVGSYQNGYISIIKLSCGHDAHINSSFLKNVMYKSGLNLLISCMDCGGNGAAEIRR